MGALLGLLVNAPAVGKPPHHVETHFECACSDTSSSSDDVKTKPTTKKETQPTPSL